MSRPLILFDLTRLLSATGRAAPTGIERVEYQYAKWLTRVTDWDVRFVATLNNTIRLVPDASARTFLERQGKTWAEGAEGFSAQTALANINSFLRGEDAPRAPLQGHLSPEERRTRQRGKPHRPSHPIASWAHKMAASWAHDPLGPVLRRAANRQPIVYLRASGDRLESAVPFERLKAAGVLMVVMSYDTIPIDYPEFVRPKSVTHCQQRVANIARLSDGIVAISHYCAARLAPHLHPFDPKVTVAHIGTEVPHCEPGLLSLVDEPFFLCVSTIEARKNHQMLLNVWRRMVDEMGTATPKLVLAGKRGWEAHASTAMLDRACDLRPYVYEAGAIPDEALNALRRKATAVLMPSFVEGFGLPVTEALSVNTPVIAADIPVFREIAGDACDLLDPLDGVGWRTAICEYAAAKSPRLAVARAKAEAYEAPTWAAHFTKVRAFMDEITAQSPVRLGTRARRALGTAALIGHAASSAAIRGTTDGRHA